MELKGISSLCNPALKQCFHFLFSLPEKGKTAGEKGGKGRENVGVWLNCGMKRETNG
jgi:hypothetical protein